MNVNLSVNVSYDPAQIPMYSHQFGRPGMPQVTQTQQTQTMHQKASSNSVIAQSANHSAYGSTFKGGSTIMEINEYTSQAEETFKVEGKDGQSYVVLQQHHSHFGLSHSQNQSGNNSPTLPPSGNNMHPKSQGNSATKPPKVNLGKMMNKAGQAPQQTNLSETFEQ